MKCAAVYAIDGTAAFTIFQIKDRKAMPIARAVNQTDADRIMDDLEAHGTP